MRPLTRLAAMSLATAVVACGGNSTSPTASIAGTWKLQTINGSPLPVVQQSGNGTLEILSKSLTLRATNSSGGSYASLDSDRYTVNGHVNMLTGRDTGTYSLNGTVGAFVSSLNGATASASLSDSSLTLTTPGFALVYRR